MKFSCALIIFSVVYLCGSLPVDTVEERDDKSLVEAVADILKKGKNTKLMDLIPMHLLAGQSKRQNRRQLRPSSNNDNPNPNHNNPNPNHNHPNPNNNINNLKSSPTSGNGAGFSLSNTYAQLQRQKHISSLQAQKIRFLQQELQAQQQKLRQTNFNQIQGPSLLKPSHEMSFVPIRQNQEAFQQQQLIQNQEFQQELPPFQPLPQFAHNYPIAVPSVPKYNGKNPEGLLEESTGMFATIGKYIDAGRTLVNIPMGLFSMVAEVAKYFNRSEMVENIKDGIVNRIFGGDSEDPFAQ